MNEKKLQYYVLICDRKQKKKFMEVMAQAGAVHIETVFGKGSARAGSLAQAMGLETEEKKAVLTALLTHDQAEVLTALLCDRHRFHQGNTGFAFSISVEGLAF